MEILGINTDTMYRKGVSAIIINSNKEFLLVNLQSFEEKYFAIPGGGIEPNETEEEAVYREIMEELGINQTFLKLISKSSNPLTFLFKEVKLNRDGKKFIGSERIFFGLEFTGTIKDIKICEEEVRKYKWVAFENLSDYLLFECQLDDTVVRIKELFPEFK